MNQRPLKHGKRRVLRRLPEHAHRTVPTNPSCHCFPEGVSNKATLCRRQASKALAILGQPLRDALQDERGALVTYPDIKLLPPEIRQAEIPEAATEALPHKLAETSSRRLLGVLLTA